MTGYLIVRHLLARGHDVSVLYLEGHDYQPGERQADAAALADMGVSAVQSVPFAQIPLARGLGRIRRRLVYTPALFRPWSGRADVICEAVTVLRPDICVLWGFEPIEGFLSVRGIPKVAGLGVFRYNLEEVRLGLPVTGASRARRVLEKCAYPLWKRQYLRNARELIASVDRAWFFADNYARACRDRFGLRQVAYLPNPAMDEREGVSIRSDRVPANNPFRIVMVGHLRGTATQSGLKFFAEKIFPVLKARNEADRYEFLLVGKFSPPEWLERLLPRSHVKQLGYVDNFADTLNAADAVLVPIPDDVGNRLRIASAFSAEACVVTHASSLLGMPELVHEDNCLVGDSAEAIASCLRRACEDRVLNSRLRAGGRRTYEQYFHPAVACERIEQFVLGDARSEGPPRSALT